MRGLEGMYIKDGIPFRTTQFSSSLIKAEEENGRWILYLEASNESKDQDGEVVVMKALKDAADDYQKFGVISWDHQHIRKKDPEYIIGEPLDVTFSENKSTLIKAFLYQKNRKAQSVWNNIQSGSTRFGASIGGSILKKSENVIASVIWRDTAITDKPVNSGTFGKIQLIPFQEFAKALTAGGGVNAAEFAGGRALTGEHLDKELVDMTFAQTDVPSHINYEIARHYFDGVLVNVLKGKILNYEDITKYTRDQGYEDGVAASLIDFISQKIPKLRR